jgi:hypothetical protein
MPFCAYYTLFLDFLQGGAAKKLLHNDSKAKNNTSVAAFAYTVGHHTGGKK